MAASGTDSSAAARLRSVAELEVLHTRLGQFVPNLQTFMQSVDAEYFQATHMLDERRRHWMRQRDILNTEQKKIQGSFEAARLKRSKPRDPRQPSQTDLERQLGEIRRYQQYVDRQIQAIAKNSRELELANMEFRAKAGQIIIWTSEIAPKARHYLQRTIAKVGWYCNEGWNGQPVPRRRVGERQTMHFPGLCARAILNRELRNKPAEATDDTVQNLHALIADMPLFDVADKDGVGAIVVYGLRAESATPEIVEKYRQKWHFLTHPDDPGKLRLRAAELLALRGIQCDNPTMFVPNDHLQAIAEAAPDIPLKPLGKTAAEIAKLVFS
jgi:hypothetical protein